ncbi:hypothetical protein TNCT_392671 [Trichonephila clavata]|uniref:Uncharacterized protein n=1 Tax=Trichonephila clavata TaxID=2740835 RepID=A0A8X6F0N7_TRICU|nr:hypothetical protein TNCT_392671 [Trichonephila clavata]
MVIFIRGKAIRAENEVPWSTKWNYFSDTDQSKTFQINEYLSDTSCHTLGFPSLEIILFMQLAISLIRADLHRGDLAS